MNDPEENSKAIRSLSASRLAPPSPELDRRIGDAFSTASRSRPAGRKIDRAWWFAGLAALGGAAAVLLVTLRHPHPSPQAEPVTYRFEAQGRMREFLLAPAGASPLPHFVTRATSSSDTP